MSEDTFTPPLPDGYLPPVLPGEPEAPAAPVDQPVVTAPPGGKVITLPSGFKVAVRNPKGIRNRERSFVYAGMVDADKPDANKIELGFELSERIVALIVTAWDVREVDDNLVPFGPVLPIPKDDLTVLGGLPMSDMGPLDAEAEEARKIIMPDFSVSPDPASPTAPSGS